VPDVQRNWGSVMSKAILEFDLFDAEDMRDFNIRTNAHNYYLIILDLDEELRKKIKYDDGMDDDVRDALINVRNRIGSLCEEYRVSLED
jgi:hypothetical protein